MSRRDKGRLAPFVPIFRHTMKTAAWQAASVGARAVFLELKANYNTNAQNAVFMSSRDGARRLGAHKDTVRKWLHELEHYGFIVEVQGAHLGVHGTGKAALYRLTDCPFAGKPPTYDFQSWDGVLYDPKKQNPVRKNRPPCPKKPTIRAESEMAEIGNKCPTEPDIRNEIGCPTEPTITSLTTPLPSLPLSAGPKLAWSLPVLTEIEYTPDLGQLFELTRLSPSKNLVRSVRERRWAS